MKKIIMLLLTCILMLVSCTDNERAKGWGGTATIDLPAGRKLINITWKGDQLWYLTRPMKTSEVPDTLSFHEDSKWGLVEGTVIIRESK